MEIGEIKHILIPICKNRHWILGVSTTLIRKNQCDTLFELRHVFRTWKTEFSARLLSKSVKVFFNKKECSSSPKIIVKHAMIT